MRNDGEGTAPPEDTRIPPRAFRRQLRDLPPEEFRQFVAALWAARGWATSVDGRAVVVRRSDGSSRRLLVVARRYSWAALDGPRVPAADSVVCVDAAAPVRALGSAAGGDVYDAAHLRRQLLYALDGEDRDRLLAAFFDVSALRSEGAPRGSATRSAAFAGVRDTFPTGLAVAAVLVAVTAALLAGGLDLGGATGSHAADTTPDRGEVTGRTVDRATLATAERDLLNATQTCDRSPEAVVSVHLIAARHDGPSRDDALGVAHRFVHPGAVESLQRYPEYESTLDRQPYAPLREYETVTFGFVRWDDETVTQRIAVGTPDGDEAVYRFELAPYERSPDRQCWAVTEIERIG